MRALFVIILLTILVLPTVAFAEVQTFTATHIYILGDHDSKDDARQRCLLEAKRKILEQAGVYIESASEVKDLQLTKDKITSFAAAVMQVKDTKEDVGSQQGHMTMTLKLTAQVDLTEVRKQLAARQFDAGVRDDVAAQKERLKRLEAQLEAIQQQQSGQSSGRAPASPPIDISAEDLQMLHTQAAQGDTYAQFNLGLLYHLGNGMPQDYGKARQWWEQAAAQGFAQAQVNLGRLYYNGDGVPQDYGKARQWWERAEAQGDAIAQLKLGALYYYGEGVPQDNVRAYMWFSLAAAQLTRDGKKLAVGYRDKVARSLTPAQIAEAQRLSHAQLDAVRRHQDGNFPWRAPGSQISDVPAENKQFWRTSASEGNAVGMHFLATMYESARGLPQDDVHAYMWYNLAAAHSTNDAQKDANTNFRDRLARRMTPAQIAEGQRLSQQCEAQQFKSC